MILLGTRNRKTNSALLLLYFITISLMFVFLPAPAFCIKSEEVVNERYEITYIDERSCIVWNGTLKNNASVNQKISLEIYARDKDDKIIAKKDMENIEVPRYSSREIEFVISREMAELEKIVKISSFIYSANEVGSYDSDIDQSERYYDSQQENARTRNEQKEKEREEEKERFRQEANEASREYESLRIRHNLKVAVYRLCPSSYPSNSECARLRREIDDLKRELDSTYRDYNRNKHRYERR